MDVNSGAGRKPFPTWAPYCTVKAARKMAMEVVAAEEGEVERHYIALGTAAVLLLLLSLLSPQLPLAFHGYLCYPLIILASPVAPSLAAVKVRVPRAPCPAPSPCYQG